MATILLVEDAPDLGVYEAGLLEAEGHRVIRCNGSPSPLAACPMLRYGSCALPDSADLILFSCALFPPMRHRTYRAADLLRAYRGHARYGRLPMLVVSVGRVDGLEGLGPLAWVDKFSPPRLVVEAVDELLARRTRPNAPAPAWNPYEAFFVPPPGVELGEPALR